MFDVGDKVVLRDDLIVGKSYGGVTLLSGMKYNCEGKILRVENVSDDGRYCDISGSLYTYSQEMFVPYEYEEKEYAPVSCDELMALLRGR